MKLTTHRQLSISRLRDGELVLICGDAGMESALVFAQGAMEEDDPLMRRQRALLEWLVNAVEQGRQGSVTDCSCHPPCNSCLDSVLTCSECSWNEALKNKGGRE